MMATFRGRPGLAAIVGFFVPLNAAWARPADPWFGHDKALHFSASAAIATGGYAADSFFSERESMRLAWGGGIALGAGVAKEIADHYTGGDPSFRDLTWDAIGTATGLLFSWGVDRTFHWASRRWFQASPSFSDKPALGFAPTSD